MAEQIYQIKEFRGLREFVTPENTSGYTRSLDNVTTRFNRLSGRGGISKFHGVSSAAAAKIVGLMGFASGGNNAQLLRVMPLAVEKFNPLTTAWVDVTGTALTGTASTTVQHLMHKDTLVWVPQNGIYRPRKYTGTGNSAALGGTPPYAKAICQNYNFLFLFNISTDGTTFSKKRGVYSEDFDNDWSACTGNELNFHETNGDIVTADDFGEWVVVFKTDAVMQVGFIGGEVQFSQQKLAYDQGLLAQQSTSKIAELGIVFLDTAKTLNVTNGMKVDPLPPFVQRTLNDVLLDNLVDQCVGVTFPNVDTYSLFYPTSETDTGARGRISYNFRTGEFNHSTYANHEFNAALKYKQGTASAQLLAATDSYVYVMDDTVANDDTSKFSRYFETDWTHCGTLGEKVLKGMNIQALKMQGARIRISAARDHNETFVCAKEYSLKNLKASGSSKYVNVPYRIDGGLLGTYFNLKVEIFHDSGELVEIMAPMNLIFEQVGQNQGALASSPAPDKVN